MGDSGVHGRCITEINAAILECSLQKLLSYATSPEKVTYEYEKYISFPNRKLYGIAKSEEFFACIGVEFLEASQCEIKHIAVSPEMRGQNIGSEMIDFICQSYPFHQIIAETDQQAVEFYRKYGFSVSSLGEKYPGVERFYCLYRRNAR